MVASINARMDKNEKRTEEAHVRIDEEHKRPERIELTLASSSRPSTDHFIPKHVTISGLYSWAERKEKGVNRDEAEKLVGQLKTKLPVSPQSTMGHVHLRGIKVHKFTVDVTPPHAKEVAWGFKDSFKSDEGLKRQGKELSANPQQDPSTEKRVGAAGKARAFLMTKCAEGSAPRCT